MASLMGLLCEAQEQYRLDKLRFFAELREADRKRLEELRKATEESKRR